MSMSQKVQFILISCRKPPSEAPKGALGPELRDVDREAVGALEARLRHESKDLLGATLNFVLVPGIRLMAPNRSPSRDPQGF